MIAVDEVVRVGAVLAALAILRVAAVRTRRAIGAVGAYSDYARQHFVQQGARRDSHTIVTVIAAHAVTAVPVATLARLVRPWPRDKSGGLVSRNVRTYGHAGFSPALEFP